MNLKNENLSINEFYMKILHDYINSKHMNHNYFKKITCNDEILIHSLYKIIRMSRIICIVSKMYIGLQ